MKRVLSFGSYLFDQDTQGQFNDNFTNGVPRTVRLPGLPGAFDELGLEPSPTEVGNLKLMFYIRAETRAAITQRRDAIRAMAGWGVRKLVMQPADQSLAPRYCYARLQNIQMPENAKTPDTVQAVNIDWQVSYPRWMQDAYGGASAWGAATWGNFIWGGHWPSYDVGTAASSSHGWGQATWGNFFWGAGQESTLTLTNDGNAVSLPRLIFTCTEAATGVWIERHVNGLVRESLRYEGSITAGQILDIDCRSLSIRLDGISAYNELEYTHPAWLPLPPGSNSLRITLPSGGGKLKVIYPHTWY